MPGTVYINPAVMADKRDAMAVAVNEALRVAMEDLRFSPAAALTPEQKRMLAGTAYEGDEDASRKTVAARIATFDSSVAPTPEQKEETLGFLNLLAEALGPSHRDAALVAAIVSALGASEAPGGEPPAGPVPEAAAGGRPAGTARDATGGGDVDWHSLPPAPSKEQLWGLSVAVAEALPGLGNAERFLYETAGAESDWGAHPDTFRKGYHGGVFQVDRKGFEDTLATESHRKNLRRHYDTIKKAFGVDWTTVKYEDIRDKPLLGALAARLLIANKPDPVPGDAEGRARYWKKHYNSHHENAKGTVEEYLKRNGFPLPSGFKEGGEPPAGPVPEAAVGGRPAGTARDATGGGDVDESVGPGYFRVKSTAMLKRLASGEDPAAVIAEENATRTKSGGVLGKLDPATWGGGDGRVSIRADTRSYRETHPLKPLRSSIDVPTMDQIVGVQASGNPVVDTVNRIVGAAATFGPAVAAATATRGVVTPGWGGLAEAAGATAGVPSLRYEVDGKTIPKAVADALEVHRAIAVEGMARYKVGALARTVPENTTFLPDRAYRRIGGVEGLRDILTRGGVFPPKFVPDPAKRVGTLSLQKDYGDTPYYQSSRPAVEFMGPYTVEVSGTPFTTPDKFRANSPKSLGGYMHDRRGGTPLEDITRIFHDDGTVVYSKARDGFSNFRKAVSSHLDTR